VLDRLTLWSFFLGVGGANRVRTDDLYTVFLLLSCLASTLD